mmetsp:Transcript_31950/g.52111  ORF Transcript_31950/g.52111 Transcript_31950/m.52111 type:complete len:248 (+) Transcript_31950:182-925(+)
MQIATMKQYIATLFILMIKSSPASSFVPSNGGNIICQRNCHPSITSLFGTIRFVGNAGANLSTPSIITNDQDDQDKSLSYFLSSSASDPVLLGTKCRKMDDDESSSGVLWECQQASVQWFGMQVTPIFINRIEKNLSKGSVVVSIIDAKTQVENGGRIGDTIASAMERSTFEGRNAITWKEHAGAQTYTLEGNLKLEITITLPRFLPIPPGFNAIGSKIVERTCKERLRQNLSGTSDAYLLWATSQQ